MKDIIIRSELLMAHVNAFGAELKGLCMAGMEYLYPGDPADYPRTSPTLFPIIGRFLSDTYFVDDRWYRMPLNGFAMNRNFQVEDRGEHHARFLLEDDEFTRSQFPYTFKLHVEYQVEGTCLHIRYVVENPGDRALPFGLGCHTAYRWPLMEQERPEDYYLRFEKEEDLESFNPFNWREPHFIQGTERALDHSLFRNFTRSVTGLQSEWVEYASHRHSHAVRIHRGEMPYLALWASPNESAKLICIEPCTSIHAGGCTTMFDRQGVTVLQPGEVWSKQFSIELRS